MSGQYEGWKNRETWWVAQFVNNDRTQYDKVYGRIIGILTDSQDNKAERIKKYLETYVEFELLHDYHSEDSFMGNILAEYVNAVNYDELMEDMIMTAKEQLTNKNE